MVRRQFGWEANGNLLSEFALPYIDLCEPRRPYPPSISPSQRTSGQNHKTSSPRKTSHTVCQELVTAKISR